MILLQGNQLQDKLASVDQLVRIAQRHRLLRCEDRFGREIAAKEQRLESKPQLIEWHNVVTAVPSDGTTVSRISGI